MITMTTMTKIKRDYHNDAKQVALGFVKNQSRIFLYAHKIRKKSYGILPIQYYRIFVSTYNYEHGFWTTYLCMGKWFFILLKWRKTT